LDTVQREPVVVTKKNRPVAVTVSLQDWEVLTQSLIEHGVTRGLEDIKAGRFEEMGEATPSGRITRFKARLSKG